MGRPSKRLSKYGSYIIVGMAERIRLGNVYDHDEYGHVLTVHKTHDNNVWARPVKGRDNAGVISTGEEIYVSPYKEFLGAVSMEDYPDNWDAIAKAVKQRDDHTCQGCGSSKHEASHTDGGASELHAHHIVPLGAGGSNARSNLITLCEECHGRVHGGVT